VGREEERWPDVVVEGRGRKQAWEIEFAPKSAERLRAIFRGYIRPEYAEVRFLASSPAVARVVARFATLNDSTLRAQPGGPGWCVVRVQSWIGAPEDVRRAAAAVIAEPGERILREWRL